MDAAALPGARGIHSIAVHPNAAAQHAKHHRPAALQPDIHPASSAGNGLKRARHAFERFCAVGAHFEGMLTPMHGLHCLSERRRTCRTTLRSPTCDAGSKSPLSLACPHAGLAKTARHTTCTSHCSKQPYALYLSPSIAIVASRTCPGRRVAPPSAKRARTIGGA